MALFYVSLQSGRTDNVYIEASSKNDILNFFQSVSNAHVQTIKKVVYSKKYLIGTSSGALAPTNKPSQNELRVMAKSQNNTSILEFRFPLKDISKDTIVQNVKKYLTIDNEPIETIISIVKG